VMRLDRMTRSRNAIKISAGRISAALFFAHDAEIGERTIYGQTLVKFSIVDDCQSRVILAKVLDRCRVEGVRLLGKGMVLVS